jgi:hypothetical protein
MRSVPPLLPAALLAALLSGCAATSPHWDRHYGQAARAALAAQVLEPDAAGHAPPQGGIDARTARAAYQRYQRSYAEPPAPPAFTIGVSAK